MSTSNEPTSPHHDPLDAVIAAYLEQVESGAVPDREALLAQHPDLADRLRVFFADYDRMDRQSPDLRLASEAEPAELPRIRYFGDYELLEVIAHGGMGVVYKARQTSLHRPVALKMIRAGQLATPRDVARFRAEAEAAANLDHPNIVPVYEVGEHEGQHYFAMRFIEGEPLSRHPRGTPRAEAHLAATLARAVHYAHQRGILHRDLKPSNVLVQQGGAGAIVPFITDFGVAKRLGSSGELTATGEAPGTPRYMAPEQASGRKDLTVAADVYSLGVVLYERLTGTPPFTSEDPLELYRAICTLEPARPSTRCPGLDRDLETICLKCLEKEPAKRYGSAEALAEDLERWQRGEPIVARPVGKLGRLRRWCQRNPVVAGLLAAVALTLLAGTAFSTYFAIQADRRATAEQIEKERAQAAEGKMEQAVVRGLVRPMNASEDARGSLSPMELESLWELAETPEPQLRLRFLKQMFATEGNADQLRSRQVWVVHSAVGLDPQQREQAERVLMESMHDPEKSLRHRTTIAWAVLGLAEPGSANQRESVTIMRQGWVAETDQRLLGIWREYLLWPEEGMPLADAVGLLTQALEKETDVGARQALVRDLASLPDRLEPAEAARVCGAAARVLMQELEKETDVGTHRELAASLALMAGRSEPAEAASVLIQALDKETESRVRRELAASLASVADRLEPAKAARVLMQALEKETDEWARCALAEGLASLASRLEPAEAARVCGAAARVLMQKLEKEPDSDAYQALAKGLASLAGRLEPAEAARVCGAAARVLMQELEKETHEWAREYLAEGLASLASRLEPAEAARVCGAAARVLMQALEKGTEFGARQALARGLASLASRLEPAEAARVCGTAARALMQELEKRTDVVARQFLAESLASLASRLEPAEAARVCGAAARVLMQALEKETAVGARQFLAKGLASLAGRLEPAEAARVCGAAVRVLMQALEKETDVGTRQFLAKGLASLAGRLEPAEAARVLIQALEKETDVWARQALAEGLALMAGRLEPAEATQVAGDVVRLLNLHLGPKVVSNPFGRVSNTQGELLAVSSLLQQVNGVRADVMARALARRIVTAPDSADPVFFSPELKGTSALKGTLTNTSPPEVRRRAVALAAVVGTGAGCPLTGLPFLPATREPFPCRLTTQDLVDLLKLPTCVGDARRIILDQLGNRYGRRFASQWDFVNYAQEQHLDLDFTTPPQRPTWP